MNSTMAGISLYSCEVIAIVASRRLLKGLDHREHTDVDEQAAWKVRESMILAVFCVKNEEHFGVSGISRSFLGTPKDYSYSYL